MSAALRELGADVFELPTIRIEPPQNLREFAELVRDAHTYEWLVFTSPNGVTAFFDLFFKMYDDVRSIGGVKIAAIGPATAAKVREYQARRGFAAEGIRRRGGRRGVQGAGLDRERDHPARPRGAGARRSAKGTGASSAPSWTWASPIARCRRPRM